MTIAPSFDPGAWFLEALRPDPDLDMVEWCKEHRRIEEASAMRGPWSPEMVPYVVDVMTAITTAGTVRVVFVGGAQVGKTENVVSNSVAYHGATRRDHIMIVLPTEDVKERLKQRLRPSLMAIPAVASMIAGRKKALKTDQWDLGRTCIIWASAASEAATVSSPIATLHLDEIELMAPATISRAEKRTQSYGHRARTIMTGTPGEEDGNAWVYYQASDQAVWEVPCDGCGKMWPYEWASVQWEPREGAGARLGLGADPNQRQYAQLVRGGSVDVWLACPHCGHRHEGRDRRRLNAKGAYRRQVQHQKRVRGFRVPALASAIYPLEDAVATWYEAQGHAGALREFFNQVLALPYSPTIAAADEGAVLVRIADGSADDRPELKWGVVPDWCQWLSLGVDVQADRCVWSVWAWATQEGRRRGHLVANGEEQGDGATSLDGLDALILKDWRTKDGQSIHLAATLIDAGYESGEVYSWVLSRRQRGGLFRSVFPVMGRTHTKDLFTETPATVHGRGEITLLTIQSNQIKTSLWNVFNDTPGLTFHADTGQRFASEFVSEHRVRRRDGKGFVRLVWEVRPGHDANHYWDASNYAHASYLYGISKAGAIASPAGSTPQSAPAAKGRRRPNNRFWSDPFGRKLR